MELQEVCKVSLIVLLLTLRRHNNGVLLISFHISSNHSSHNFYLICKEFKLIKYRIIINKVLDVKALEPLLIRICQ